MSVSGPNNLAASIAQTALNAQQVARQRHRTYVQAGRDARQMQEILRSHLEAVEEGDETASPGQIRIDTELPQQRGQPQDQQRKPKRRPSDSAQLATPPDMTPTPGSAAITASSSSTTPADGDAPSPNQPPLYKHLDVSV